MPETTTDGYQLGLYFGDAATYADSITFTEVAQVTECTPPTIALDEIDTKHLKTADRYKTTKAGWRDAGEVAVTVQYEPTQYATLADMVGQAVGWKIVFNDNGTTTDGGVGFSGWLKSLGQPVDGEGLVTVTLSIRVTSLPVVVDPATA